MTVDNQDVRWFSLLGVIVLVVFAYIFLPRYEWKTVSDDRSVSIIVYDRWTGRIQRVVYDNSGSLNVMGVYVPF
jgi:hypothetical protein